MTNLENIVHAIRFARHHYEGVDPAPVTYQQACTVLNDIKVWRSSLGKRKRSKAQLQLEQLSKAKLDLEQVNHIVECGRILIGWCQCARLVIPNMHKRN